MLPFIILLPGIEQLSLMVLSLPFFSFLLLFLFAHYLPGKGDLIATLFSFLSFVFSVILFVRVWGEGIITGNEYTWFEFFSAGKTSLRFTASIKIYDLSAIMLVLVCFISFLVHLYSLEYMKGKRNYSRYYPYLGLFTFSMLGIVLSDNLLITFMFWELVGFSSYLLIGFWYEKEEATRAAKKAFLFNRIGDTGFLIAILAIYFISSNPQFRTFEISTIKSIISSENLAGSALLFWIGLGIFAGCIGKSAQFPLQAWLPDAMEGPTPVSALIHAATMVAAGVYLLVKLFFLLHPDTLYIIALIGAVTAFAGALPALFQNDIKKVLAYSTISQLGYMVMAIGVGAPGAAFFHLITHGFFKACLFLSAGAVIHSMHHIKHDLFIKGQYRDFDSQDMRLMGGFYKRMPVTFYAYLISALALMGLPLFTGFLSKDAILESAWLWPTNSWMYLIPSLASLTVIITAVYIVRQTILIFFGEFRLPSVYPFAKEEFEKVKDPSFLMKIPLIILSLFCIWIFFSPNPLDTENGWLFKIPHLSFTVTLISVILTLSGIIAGYFIFRKSGGELLKEGAVVSVLKNNWYLDQLYYKILVAPGMQISRLLAFTDTKIIDGALHFLAISHVVFAHIIAWFDRVFVDGTVNLCVWIAGKTGGLARSFQTGRIQGYFIFALIALLSLLIWIIIQS
ncbi:MAG: NADH-quinone oxidoreductase subunit L [Cytophagaceae bacterium]|nr:NADH-quinone oxidoreductase subunit L [Cytophagaceae bacterium]